MKYVIYEHHESECIGIVTREEWNKSMSSECDELATTHTMPEAIMCARQEAMKTGYEFLISNLITPDILNQVAAFHILFDHPILAEPQIPSQERAELRYRLLAEELQEFRDALDKRDLVGVADAFADIQYVLAGAILEFGMGEVFALIFEEVQRSNMSKACATEYEADMTIEHYAREYPCYKKQRDGRWFVYRTSDNKTLKAITYSPADIKSIL